MKKDIEEFSLNEIKEIQDQEIREYLLKEFERIKNEMFFHRLPRRASEKYFDNSKSLIENYYRISSVCQEHVRLFLFPGHDMILYPKVTYRHATKTIWLHLGDYKIEKGDPYCVYRPLIEDLTTNKKYVLKKSLFASLDCVDLFPQDFRTFEEWDYKLQNAYFNPSELNGIDFYEFSCRLKDDELTLLELKDDCFTRKKRRLLKELHQLEKLELQQNKNIAKFLNIEKEKRKLMETQKRICEIREKIRVLGLKKENK